MNESCDSKNHRWIREYLFFRLNFLTPRYVNRKGIALPSSTEETKKNKRENLEQKQVCLFLIPS